ncbi:hypothetical protein D1794_29570 (plasmid) [Streptomyces clavuligerus]|nr:hypothetical protein D1794_29570 [Streptomyces clavuligerus]
MKRFRQPPRGGVPPNLHPKRSPVRRRGWRSLGALTLPGALILGVLGVAPVAAVESDEGYDLPAPTDRGRVVEAWNRGGPGVKAAAEAALIGTEEDIQRFLNTEKRLAQHHDDRIDAVQVFSVGGPLRTRGRQDRALRYGHRSAHVPHDRLAGAAGAGPAGAGRTSGQRRRHQREGEGRSGPPRHLRGCRGIP